MGFCMNKTVWCYQHTHIHAVDEQYDDANDLWILGYNDRMACGYLVIMTEWLMTEWLMTEWCVDTWF